MTKTYERASGQTQELVTEAMRRWHPVLHEVGVNVDVLFIDEVDEDGQSHPALKVHGYPAVASIALVSLKHRALGVGDALLTIDAATWHEKGDAERMAILDHELTHLEVCADPGGIVGWDASEHKLVGKPKVDDLGRPKLRLRLHDVQIGGFREVAKRHASASAEAAMVRALVTPGGQLTWDWQETVAADEMRVEMGLCDDGVDSVEVSTPTLGRPVTFTRESGDRLREAAPAE